jgi:hypothetical protein
MLTDEQLSGTAPISGKSDTLPAAFNVDPPSIERLRKMFDDSREASQANRLLCQRDRGYYDGPEQLNSDVRRILKARGQPPIYVNRIKGMIDGILGVLDGAKVDPRAYPRNPTDDNAADVATKTLRFISDVSNFKETKLDCAENFLIEGTCAIIIEAAGEDIPATQIRHEEHFADPYSRRNDFKDAKYQGIAKWMDAADVKGRYPDRWKAIGDPLSGGQGALETTWQDRPNNFKPWIDRQRQRLMMVEVYYNEVKPPEARAQWYRCVYCAQGVFEHDLSPYVNPKTGETVCPIEAESCYVDRENNRYGRIRDAIPIQDEVNARRSRGLHLLNSRQIQERELGAAQVDANTARKEAARADGVIPVGWMLVPTQDLAAGNMLLLNEAKSELDRMGPTPAVLGRADGANQSGRSRQVLQQAGMTELARPLGRFSDWENRCYRQMWMRAQQFWSAPMFIRVTDETRAPDFIKVNEPAFDDGGQPVLATDEQGNPQMQPVTGPDGQPVVDPATGQPQMQPVQKVNNRLAEMDMDIEIDTVPDTANLAQEVWADLLSITERIPMNSPDFMLAVELSPMPDKARIIERLKQMQQEQAEQAQAQQQQAQEAAELLKAKEVAEIHDTAAAAALKRAQEAGEYFEMGAQVPPDDQQVPPDVAPPQAAAYDGAA